MRIKLDIMAYSDRELRSKVGIYSLQINPEKMNHDHNARFSEAKESDAAGPVPKFHIQSPQTLSFEFVLDATGVVHGTKSVNDEVDTFKDIAYTYHGKTHSPNYLKVVWGDTAFKCRLSKLDINYELFAPSGEPLRARLSVALEQHQAPQDLGRCADKTSADLTLLQPGQRSLFPSYASETLDD